MCKLEQTTEYPEACREGGTDVKEHWYTERVLTNRFFDCRIVRLGEERERLGQFSFHWSSHDGTSTSAADVWLVYMLTM